MKLRISLLLAVVLMTGACQRARLSPVVLQSPAEEKGSKTAAKAPEKQAGKPSSKVAETSHDKAPVKSGVISEKPKTGGTEPVAAKIETKEERLAEAARLAAKKKRQAAARRAQARRLAAASLEAGRLLLREEQHTAALRAFRESVRLYSHSPEAWMGIAFSCERSGNTKEAIDAFREAKKLWGM